jgi:cyclopropane fatty-acyl-phospholipid synthase-like methyltransferase
MTIGADAIDLLFGGMEKLGPGSDADTLHVLRRLPLRQFGLVVDAGCGTGRQTLVLARALGVTIHAVDSHEPFLRELGGRARQAGVAGLVQIHCMDMKDIPQVFRSTATTTFSSRGPRPCSIIPMPRCAVAPPR